MQRLKPFLFRPGQLLAVLLLFTGALLAQDALAAKKVCGDGICAGNEPSTCPADCPVTDVCGDGICAASESPESCPADCESEPPPPSGDCNNDGVCNAGEDCTFCADCPGRTGGNPKNRFCCGSTTCEAGSCGANCGADVPECGDYVVDYDEECDDGPSGSPTCDIFCKHIEPAALVPLNQFNIGDSIGEAEAAYGTIGNANHQSVWSTGWSASDPVNSLNERFEARDAVGYAENNSTRDGAINQAISGAKMNDFAAQAQAVLDSMGSVPPGSADMVTVLLGNNDVCASSMAAMTDPVLFEQQYRAGLDVLASSSVAPHLNVLVSGIPAIYWLWDAKRSNFWCRAFAWPFVPCENLLDGAADDCASSASAEDPDNDYADDGPNCQRRKLFHATIRDVYNPILRDVLADYQEDLPNAEYVDVYDVRFGSNHVNGGDCFHPSADGHALLSGEQWCRSHWGEEDPVCGN